MNDPVIDETRRVRKLISAEMGHDPSRMVEYYREIEAGFTRPAIAPQNRRAFTDSKPGDATVSDGVTVASTP